MDDRHYSARLILAERIGALRGNISAAIAYLEGIDDCWAKQALRTLTAAYEDDTRRGA